MWQDFLIFLGSIVLIYTINYFKPEWVLLPLLKALDSKFKTNSNAISNALGLKMLESGIYTITFVPDDEESQKLMEDLKVLYEKVKANLNKNQL